MRSLRLLLFPFAVLYDIATAIRNRLYDQNIKPSTAYDIPVISVGNLAVGGTGKTPMIEHMVRLLSPKFKVATLSRGYGRNTKGFRVAGANDSALTIGDEPFQYYKKFNRKVIVAVGEERALAIAQLANLYDGLNVILMDDAFQHRKVRPSFQVLLTDYNNIFYKDFLLPAGNLRESARGARRADVIIVTKCPVEISEEKMMEIDDEIRKIADKPVFFTSIRYGDLVSFKGPEKFDGREVILLSGIANPAPLELYVRHNFKLQRHFRFADHHQYSVVDVVRVCEEARKHKAAVITTEKDASRLVNDQFSTLYSDIPFFYLPIEVEFLKNGEDFDEMVLNQVHRVNA